MTAVNQDEWEAAASRLFEDKYSLVATGPRVSPDWRLDAVAVMNRDFADPRGWSVLDWDRENAHEMAEHGPAFPFIRPTTELLTERLYEISADTALLLLVAMTDDWCNVRNAPGYPEKSECLLGDARSLLARYGAQFACYTNVTDARTTKTPDLSRKAPGWMSLTQYTADYGLVVVSETEIGLFWSFNPV